MKQNQPEIQNNGKIQLEKKLSILLHFIIGITPDKPWYTQNFTMV